MKSKYSARRPFFPTAITLAGLALAAPLASADIFYWDNNGVTSGFGTAGGTWAVPTVNQWSTDSTGTAAPGASVTTAITDFLNFGNGVTGLAAGTITVSGTVDAGGLTFASGSGAVTLSGGTINFGSTAATATVNNASNTISSILTGSAGLTKTGTGSLTLNGSAVNTLTGGLSVTGGTLALTYANLNSDQLIDSGNSLSIANGTFSLTGNNTASSIQSFTGTSLGVGTNNITLAKGATATSVTLNLGALTTVAGSLTTINPNTVWANSVPSTTEIVKITSFNGNSLPGAAAKVNVNAGLFYRAGTGGVGTARWVSVDSAGQLQGLPITIAVLNATGSNATDATQAYQISGNNVAFASTAANFYGLVLNPSANGRTLALAAGGTLSINGILGLQASNTTTINAGSGTSNIIIGSEKNLVINMDNGGGTNNGNLTINAPIANNGSTNGAGGTDSSVTIASTSPGAIGNVTLAGANTYSGGTYFSSGVLVAGSNTALGSGTVTIGGSAMRLLLGDAVNLANPIVINGGVGAAGTGVLNFGGPSPGSVTFSGPITINAIPSVAGHFSTSNGSPGTMNLTGLITSSVQINHRNGIVVYSGGGTGFTDLLVTGTARLGANNGLATTASVALGAFAAGTLDLAGFNQTLVGITKGAQAATIGNSSTTADSTLTTTGTSSYSGTIVDVIGSGTQKVRLTVAGGSLALSGANIYTGTTTVSAGVLAVNGSLGNTSTTVTGGTLQGSGSISGSVTIGSGGTLAPGNSIESFGVGDLSFTNDSTFAYELDSSSLNGDLAASSGTLDIAATSTLTLTQLASGVLAQGSKLTLISYFGGWTSGELFTYNASTLADNSTFTLGSNIWFFDYDDTTGGSNFNGDQTGATRFVTMTVIPEPRAALLGALGLLALLRRRR